MASPSSKRPNFLIIVADDLGYSDLKSYGGEIHTPVTDRLAREGVRMTNFHTASACSPTRSMLFSGTDNHIAGLGEMAEYMRSRPEYYKDKPGYEGYLNWRVAALSEILQDNGYFTLMSGKWHLGMNKKLAPCSRGFDKNFTFLPGAGNHYNFEPQLDSKDPFIPVVKTDDFWMENDKPIGRDTLPQDFYSSTTFTDRLLGFLRDRSTAESEKPFFAYLPYTAPHWPLQAPAKYIAKYKGKYKDGPDALTATRLQRMKDLGLIDQNVESAPPTDFSGKAWTDMSAEEQETSARKMEVYAAMVELMDENIGRVVEYLESSGELDNTFVLFMSDNGAEGASLEAMPVMGGEETMGRIIAQYYDNSFDNIGNPNSFVWYGPRWASAATAPARAFKCWITEGGIRCPCIVRYPRFAVPPQAVTHAFTTVMDVLPTVLELAEVKPPGSRFRGREVVLPRGKSWVRHLSSSSSLQAVGVQEEKAAERGRNVGWNAETSVHGEDAVVHGWELFGQRALRQGRWKAVWIPLPRGKADWELFDLDRDPAEMHDLAAREPAVLQRLIELWEKYYAETGMVAWPEKEGKMY